MNKSKSICDISRCHAACCYNVPMPKQLLTAFSRRIVNPVISKERLDRDMIVPHTSENIEDNKCPFLTERFRCNIYDYRPEVCKKFGTGLHPLLRCSFLDKDTEYSADGIINNVIKTLRKNE